MAEDEPVVVLISLDPRVTARANEAMRIGLGILSGENAVTFVLTGPAVHLLDEDTDDLEDGDDVAKFRATLRALGVAFHIEAGARPPEGGWNRDGHPVVEVGPAEIAALIRGARRVLVF
ncbi:MAG: hypothetical protein FJ027_01910 [Candidatus Rokubacteria bacterium]|nr:hypothetical protein [Candidatus Rokubacteria bacterium]